MDVYADILLAFPQEWARFGERFVPGLASDIDHLRPSALDSVMSSLAEELREIMRTGSSEFVYRALGLAYKVIAESIALRAHALWQTMLSHLVLAYRLSTETENAQASARAAELSLRYQFELANFHAGLVITDRTADFQSRLESLQLLDAWFDSLIELMKLIIEAEDLERLRWVNDQWEQVLEHWDPEFDDPNRVQVEIMEREFGPEDQQVVQARADMERNQELASLKADLVRKRQRSRFGLLWWAFRVWEAHGSDSFDIMLESFVTMSALADAASAAMRSELEEMPPWSRWLLASLPEGRAHALATDSALIGAFLAASMIKMNGETISVADLKWLGPRRDEAGGLLDSLAADPRILSRMNSETASARVGQLKTLISTAAAEQAEDLAASLRSAPLNEQKVQSFHAELRSTWESDRLLAPLFRHHSRFELVEEPRTLEQTEGLFGRNELLSKGLFTDIQPVIGLDMVAHERGSDLARGEVQKLIGLFDEAPQGDVGDRDIPAAVTNVLNELREAGYNPSAIFLPVQWRLNQELGLAPVGPMNPPAPPWLADERSHWYEGSFEEVDVFESTAVPGDRLLAVDIARWGRVSQWLLPGGDELLIELTSFDEAEALELLRDDLRLLADKGGEEERVKALMERVRLRLIERFAIEVSDQDAARSLPIPEPLRGPG